MPLLPIEVVERYFTTAKNHQGTSGMILKDLQRFARREARKLVQAGASKHHIADAFKQLADECADAATGERWTNDYALHVADAIRNAVMSVRM